MILLVLKKNCSFLPTFAPFIGCFRKISVLTSLYIYRYIYIRFVCYVEFEKPKKDLETLFLAATRLLLEKKYILTIFRIIFQKHFF